MTSHILLKMCSRLTISTLLLTSLAVITNAQETKPETLSAQSEKIQPAQIQQIGPAFGGVPAGQGDGEFGARLARQRLLTSEAPIDHVNNPYDNLPDAPKPASTCGPSWLGGCYNQSAPKPSNWAVIKSPLFIWPTTAEWLAAGFDVGVTWRGLQEHKCVEANPIYGPHPSLKDLALTNLAAHGAITGLRFVMLKAIPVNEKSKWRRLPQIVAVGGGFGSAALQMKSGLAWFQDGCL